MSDTVTITINGRTVTGDRKTIGQLLLNTGDIYISSKNGPMQTSDMSDYHLKNAILATYREWIQSISDNSMISNLLSNLTKGPVGFGQMDVLLKELARRSTR